MSDYLSKLFGLSGRRALVTGAAQGNGLAIAEALLRAGAEVWMVDKNLEELKSAVSKFRKSRLKATTVHANLSSYAGVMQFMTGEIMDCDIVVNNAGISLAETNDEAWNRTIGINLIAPTMICNAILPRMVKRKRGSIINITSLNDRLAFPDNAAYMASKAALGSLTRSIALDYGRQGIRCNNLCPGYVRTQMTKASWEHPAKRERRTERTMLGRWGVPSDLAGAAVFLASDASSYVTGIDLHVDAGWSVKGL